MITLHSNKHTLEVSIQKATFERYDKFRSHIAKLQSFRSVHAEQERGFAIIQLIKKYPELLGDLVNKQGGMNEETIERKAQAIAKKKEIDIVEARQEASKEVIDTLMHVASENKEIYTTLVMPDLHYPTSFEAIKYAIEVIKETCDIEKLNDKNKKIFNSAEFWNNVEFEGVAAYADMFLRIYS